MGAGTMKNFISTAILATAATACASSPLSDPTPEPVPLYAGPWAGAGVDMDAVTEPNPSLWATSPNALLSMRRAKAVGDLLTVVVEMNDQANLKSSLSRSHGSSEDMSIDALLGLPDVLNNALPGSASVSPAIDFQRNSNMAAR